MRTLHRNANLLAVALTAGIVAWGGSTLGASPAQVESIVSHFLCYEGSFAPFESVPGVIFEDQFALPVIAQVGRPRLMCNPVRKTRGTDVTKIVSKRHHLKAYRVPLSPFPFTKTVLDSNQFGADQEIEVTGDPSRVLVPTRKAPHGPPVGVDHYLCYDVLEGKAIDRRVGLKDQFGSFRARVGKPLLHCNSTSKTHPPGFITLILHPGAHLACYRIRPRELDPPQRRRTRNQFEKAKVTAKVAVMLCVPSTTVVVP